MSNLLEKASIITTPTAYDDGRILSVKPNENIYGSELVTSFTNGTSYPLDTFVSSGNNITSLIKSNGFGGCVSNGSSYTANDKVIVSFTYTKNSGDDLRVLFSSVVTGAGASVSNFINISESGDYTLYFTISSTTTAYLQLGTGGGSASINGSITNVSAKKDLSGDFNFERGSAATRVNAQGLVENVQILSSELVQNGNFSEIGSEEVTNGDFSQEGSELVTNSDMEDGFTNGVANNYTVAFGTPSQETSIYISSTSSQKISAINGTARLQHNNINVAIGSSFKASCWVRSDVSQSVQFEDYNGSGEQVTQTILADTWTNLTFYIKKTNNTFIPRIQTTVSETGYLLIDNVSVVEVGQDWSFGTGWSIGEDKAVSDGVSSSSYLYQENILTLGATYKVTVDVTRNSGEIRFYITSSITQTINSSGTFTFYATCDRTDLDLYIQSINFNGSITNISVKEVGQDWTLQSGWSIGDNKVICDGTNGAFIYQSTMNLPINKKVIITVNITSYTSGSIRLGATYVAGNNVSGVGTHSEILTTSSTGNSGVEVLSSNFIGSIDNISVKEITDDTDLPRINYEGFSYQDVLGSEEVVNGDFATDSVWIKNTNWSISDGEAIANGTTNDPLFQNNVVTANKSYKVTFTITDISQGTFYLDLGLSTSGIYYSSTGTYTETITSGSGNTRVYFRCSGNTIGSIDNVSVKEITGQEVVPNSGCGSWLFEPQSTNLLTYSEDFSNAAWSKLNSIITPNQGISPNGGNNASKYVGSTTQQDLRININVTSNYTYSIYVKAINSPFIRLRSTDGSCWFNMTTNTVATNNFASAEIKSVGNDWYRLSVTSSSFTAINAFYVHPHATDNTTYELNGGEFLLWGAMVEQLPYPTSYIPTDGAASTRLQDIANNSGNSDLFNDSEGVLYAEIAALANDGTFRGVSISDGTNNNRIALLFSNNSNIIRAQVLSNNSLDVLIDKPITTTQSNKFAFSYNQNDFKFWINGIEVGTDTSGNTPIGLNSLQFNSGSGGSPFYGKTKALAVWKEALTDTELRLLTYPNPVVPTFDLDFDTIAEQFTFTRGSEATFVNEQGLIQSTNELGAELITNGDFATDSNWVKQTGWSISDGKAIANTNGSFVTLYQNNVLTIGRKYKLSFDVTDFTQGAVRLTQGGNDISGQKNSVGTYVNYFTATATTIDAQGMNSFIGSIDNVSVKEVISATNTPRIDYSTGVEAFLLEPQSTNLITYSEDFSDSIWVDDGVTLTENFTTSPEGVTNGTKLADNTDNGRHRIYLYSTFTSGDNYTFSVFVKKNSSNKFLLINAASAFNARAALNLDTLEITNINGTNGKVENYGNGWYRFSVSGQASNTGSIPCFIQMQNTPSDVNYIGDGSSFYIWGAQLEQKSYATSYIPTDGATATRNGETCADATPTINSEEGVLYFEASALANDGTYRLISLENTSDAANYFIYLGYSNSSNQIRTRMEVGGVPKADMQFVLSNETEFNKYAIKWKANDFALWVNGVEVATDTSGSTFSANTLDKLSFNRNSTLEFNGNTKGLQVFDKALADVQLEALTSWQSFTEMANALNYTII